MSKLGSLEAWAYTLLILPGIIFPAMCGMGMCLDEDDPKSTEGVNGAYFFQILFIFIGTILAVEAKRKNKYNKNHMKAVNWVYMVCAMVWLMISFRYSVMISEGSKKPAWHNKYKLFFTMPAAGFGLAVMTGGMD